MIDVQQLQRMAEGLRLEAAHGGGAKFTEWADAIDEVLRAMREPVDANSHANAQADDRPTTSHTMNSRGGLVTDRAALHASKEYKNQVEAALKLSESLGKNDRPTWEEVRKMLISAVIDGHVGADTEQTADRIIAEWRSNTGNQRSRSDPLD